jgi:hypothetical protein
MITDKMIEAAKEELSGWGLHVNDGRYHDSYEPVSEGDLKAMAVSILEAAEQARWQPIEDAPKDGTFILACGGIQHNDGYMQFRNKELKGNVLCCWESDDTRWEESQSIDDFYEPTHFQPSPTMGAK